MCQLVRRVRPRQSGVRARVSGGHHFTDLTPRRPTRLHNPPTNTKPTTVVSFPLEVKCYDNTKTSLCMRLQSVL